jgi:hypothetical protein
VSICHLFLLFRPNVWRPIPSLRGSARPQRAGQHLQALVVSKPAFDQNLLAVVGPKVLEADSSRAEDASEAITAGSDHNAANRGLEQRGAAHGTGLRSAIKRAVGKPGPAEAAERLPQHREPVES